MNVCVKTDQKQSIRTDPQQRHCSRHGRSEFTLCASRLAFLHIGRSDVRLAQRPLTGAGHNAFNVQEAGDSLCSLPCRGDTVDCCCLS